MSTDQQEHGHSSPLWKDLKDQTPAAPNKDKEF